MSEDLLLQFMRKAVKEHATPLISSISFQFPKRHFGDQNEDVMRRTGLGIHRTQAGRRGIRLGRASGWRPAALRLRRRSTLSPLPLIPAAQRPGGAARVLGPVPARARNYRHSSRPPLRARARCITVTVTGPP
jgi:hypothetical protein